APGAPTSRTPSSGATSGTPRAPRPPRAAPRRRRNRRRGRRPHRSPGSSPRTWNRRSPTPCPGTSCRCPRSRSWRWPPRRCGSARRGRRLVAVPHPEGIPRGTVREPPRGPYGRALVDEAAPLQPGQPVAGRAPPHVVSGPQRGQGPGVVHEPGQLAEARGLDHRVEVALYALHRVVEPPRAAEAQRRVVPRQRRQLAGVSGLVERVDDEPEAGLVAEG